MTKSVFKIRKCTVKDAKAVLALWRAAETTASVTDTVANVRRAASSKSIRFLVGQADGQIVGSIIGTFDGWRGNIYRLAVHPAYRRRGLARLLVTKVNEWFARKGVKRVTALVEKDHPWAIGFWKAAGYKLDHRIVRFVLNLK